MNFCKNCGECGENKYFTAFHIIFYKTSPHQPLWQINVRKAVKPVNAVKKKFITKKESAVYGFEPLTNCMSTTSYCTAASVTYFNVISCKFKTSVEISG